VLVGEEEFLCMSPHHARDIRDAIRLMSITSTDISAQAQRTVGDEAK
jgi:hypothetical protein